MEEYSITDEFVTFDIALKLKELGFNTPCLAKFCKYNRESEMELLPESQNFFKGYFNFCTNDEYKILSELRGDSNDKYAAPMWQQVVDWFITKDIDIHHSIRMSDPKANVKLEIPEHRFIIFYYDKKEKRTRWVEDFHVVTEDKKSGYIDTFLKAFEILKEMENAS